MIKFVKSRFHYESYTDFWKLVELSGFEWCYVDQINPKSNDIYIVLMVDPERDKYHFSWWQWKRKNARLIYWDLERPKPRGGLKKDKRYLHHLRFDEIWHSDAQLAKDLGTRFVILGSDERLGNKQNWLKKYNIVHMSYENGRRGRILEQLKRVAPNGWGRHKDRVLRQSRFGLSIHQDNDLYIEPLRLALFAAYQLPIISEETYDSFPYELLTIDYPSLPEFIVHCLDGYKKLRESGKENYHKMCFEYRFKNMVEYAIKS